ncbi:MAG: acetyl-CoA carboxylase biotin carboxyl carrier protein [Thermoguttaceae bacterium]|nr:acetyl-CoA carboxylase biotin carboxyl carrier protein [Thermoguttaceae bacterium]
MAKRQKESAEKAKADTKKAPKKETDALGIGQISDLVNLMKKNELTEFSFENGKFKISLKRGCGEAAGAVPVQAVYPAAVPPAAPAAAPAPAEKPAPEDESFIELIKSPMVGTFYASSSPKNPPFVAVGDVIGPDKTVCIIEAMKVFNEIKGDVSGKIVAVLVKDGEAVEFGRPLFKVDTRG